MLGLCGYSIYTDIKYHKRIDKDSTAARHLNLLKCLLLHMMITYTCFINILPLDCWDRQDSMILSTQKSSPVLGTSFSSWYTFPNLNKPYLGTQLLEISKY